MAAAVALAIAVVVTACSTGNPAQAPVFSDAITPEQAGLVDIRSRVPGIDLDIRYAGFDNFIGSPVDGYLAPRCLLLESVADALQRVEADLRQQGQRLRIFDCYRPIRAVQHFMRWVEDDADQVTRATYYPNLPKSALRDGYIAALSGHSRGATVDLTLLECDGDDCLPLDMGTPFDFFDPLANTESPDITPAQRDNRHRLRAAMERHGFRNYPMEWWHYTFQPEPSPNLYHDVPVKGDDTASDTQLSGRIDALMARYQGEVPGAALLVIRDGEPVVRRGYGLAELETGRVVTLATNFRLASITKQFTSAAVLLLAEDGRIGLDDPVKQWLPGLPAAADAVTIRHLLTHTSGLIDYEDVMPDDLDEQLRDADVLALLEDQDRLYFAPGTDYRYSNSGYALLALIVERASGSSFQQFLRERIFEPLGMDGTLAYVKEGPEVPSRAYGYSEQAGGWARTDQSLTSAVLGDGGIYSSIDDLARWDAALYDDRLLSDASRELAFDAATSTDDPDIAYGFGWRITGDSLWHSGESIGFRNVLIRYPQRRLTVILLSNRNDPEPYETALRIAALFGADAGR